MKDLKNSRLQTTFYWLLILVPVFFVFKTFFLPGPLVWGDAPYIYAEGLKELVAQPSAWTNLGNNFGAVNSILWISPIMLLYGLLHNLFQLGNDLIIRILFYFPSVLLSVASPILLARYLKLSKTVQFFSGLIFSLNTYFLLLIDGGQVGIALAYSLFPLGLLFLRKLIDKPGHKTFFLSLAVTFLMVIVDPRVAAICLLTFILWVLIEWLVGGGIKKVKNLKYLFPLGLGVITLSSYWLIPLLKVGGQSLSLEVSRLQLLSLLNPLLLFQPHWPLNEFGRVFPPPFYFIGIPILIFGSLLLGKKKDSLVFVLLFLIFAFLTKGETPPLGGLYRWVLSTVPLFSAFRDSSKFFAPLALFAGFLIGTTVEKLNSKILAFGIYIFLLFLISPALAGKMNFVLSERQHSGDYKIVYENLRNKDGFFRTVWFPERYPLAFYTQDRPALDAKGLANFRPFASMNVGTFDLFNFMHNEQFLEWFDLLGIKYLVFSGDPRKVSFNEKEQKNWNDLLALTATTSGLLKADWETDLSVYEVPETKPRIFAVDKIIAVVGGDDIYEKLSIRDQGIVFFEDGKFDPRKLDGVSSDSAVLVFNNKEEIDLTMSFLQEYFVGVDKAEESDWAFYRSQDYLDWKYQLLIRDIDTKEFDYGKGIAFSTQTDEKLQFDLKASKQSNYVLAVRSMVSLEGGGLKVDFGGEPSEISNKEKGRFEWFIKPVSLNEGTYKLTLENPEGFNIVNIVALIPKNDWDEAQQLSKRLRNHFDSLDMDNLVSLEGKNRWVEVNFEKISPVRYKITLPEVGKWIVFSDSYHPKWKLKKGVEYFDSYPLYSMINGFYIDSLGEAEIVFEGQKDLRLGFYISGAVLVLVFASSFVLLRRKRS